MSLFDTFVMVDWSGGNDTGAKPRKDAIWACIARSGVAGDPVYLRNRRLAEDWIADILSGELDAGRRVLVGFDFPFGYPAGFAHSVCGSDNPLDLWDWLETRIVDQPSENNRFDVAADLNNMLGAGKGPFWANALKRDIKGLARTKDGYQNPFADRRACETKAPGSFTCWQLAGAGAVGSQVLTGLPVLARLRRRFADEVSVWPFESLDRPVAFVEIWPSLTLGKEPVGEIRDAWQVSSVARSVSALPDTDLEKILAVNAPEEGWIFGLCHEPLLRDRLQPPPLRNDCFALPAGVDWIPVDDALAHLEQAVSIRTDMQSVPLASALGRVLASDIQALRSNPPHANSAVDGYGFAGGRPEGAHVLPLDPQAAVAGGITTPVQEGTAIRILTGAMLPQGVDTVVLQEDVTTSPSEVAFHGPVRAGANTRAAGEDVCAGEPILKQGQRLRPPDLAIAAATGHARLPVFRKLRVGVLSTGDELLDPGAVAQPGQIHDANRPMLLGLLEGWGFEVADLGRSPDNREALAQILSKAAPDLDAVLTSGGASAGDEDHVSALLRETGSLDMWRIAIKPGRPLALGLWEGVPVFGLPGNPVAALVCSLVFARPALLAMAGEPWQRPEAIELPAAFSKQKKPGRMEYLRARIENGRVHRFVSEGSGRISGLSWASGLVELPHEAVTINEGDPVRFLPYAAFGI